MDNSVDASRNERYSQTVDTRLSELLAYCLLTRNDLEWALMKEGQLKSLIQHVEGKDVLDRKVAFTTIMLLLHFWKRNKRIKFPALLKSYFYEIREHTFFSYNIERESEYEYFS